MSATPPGARAPANGVPPVERHAELESTNTRALERLRAEGPNAAAFTIVTDRQTAGRGRHGRTWDSPVGASLAFSVAMPLAPASWAGLSIALGCALADALEPPVAGIPPRLLLKWPNDLLLRDASCAGGIGRKLAGLLVETMAWPGEAARRGVVVGCGINLAAPGDASLHAVDASHPWQRASLRELDARWDAERTLEVCAAALAEALPRFAAEGLAAWHAAFARRDALHGVPVEAQGAAPDARPWRGAGLADDGGLRLVDDAGRARVVQAGEVRVRPVVASAAGAPQRSAG